MERKQAIGYVRVSTNKQVLEGLSIEAQTSRIEAWALAHDYELIEVYKDEGLTGANLEKRKGMLNAIDRLQKGMAFVCYSISRVSRDVEDTLNISRKIEKKGADLVSLSEKIDTTGAAGKMVFNMLAVLNQFERDLSAERTKNVMQYKKAHDQYYSPLPYGYDLDAENGKLVVNLNEALVVLRIVDMYYSKDMSYSAIANKLNELGIPTKKGKEWHRTTVRLLLQRTNLNYEKVSQLKQ